MNGRETTFMDRTIPEMIEIVSWWERSVAPTTSEVLFENLQLRAKVSFYESRIAMMADVMVKGVK